AAAAANIFHFYELAYPFAKKACLDAGLPMRPVQLDNKWFRREPVYDHADIKRRLDDRIDRARRNAGPAASVSTRFRIRYCSRCVYPSISAAPMEFNADGVCMGCLMAERKVAIPSNEWERRTKILKEMLEQSRADHPDSPHDCIVPVSGGKDS